MKTGWIKASLLAVALGASGAANAAAFYNVAGTSRPWDWTTDGLNSAYQFGTQDGTGPTIASFASAGITAGGSWAVLAVSGLTSAFGGTPTVGNNGYVGSPFKDNDPGSSGNFFPGHYMPTEWNADPGAGLFLNALVATFTDDNGQIVGNPFSVGTVFFNGMSYSYLIGVGGIPTPAGATRIQLGLNDDIFSDNTGSLKVCVGDSFDACDALISGGVPEPASWALMIAGFGLTGAALRKSNGRRRAKVTVSYA
jgi:PEP-CTERM motif